MQGQQLEIQINPRLLRGILLRLHQRAVVQVEQLTNLSIQVNQHQLHGRLHGQLVEIRLLHGILHIVQQQLGILVNLQQQLGQQHLVHLKVHREVLIIQLQQLV